MTPEVLIHNFYKKNAAHPNYPASLVREHRTNPENDNPLKDEELELRLRFDEDLQSTEFELSPSPPPPPYTFS